MVVRCAGGGRTAAAELQDGGDGAADRRRRNCRRAAMARQIGGGGTAGRRRWRGRSAAVVLQNGGDLGGSPLPSPPYTEIPNAGFPWPLSYSHGEVTSTYHFFIHQKQHTRYSFLPPLYRREKERGVALRAVP